MEQRVDDKGRESQGNADGQAKKVVATRTVDKLLEQSRLSAPGNVRNHGEGKGERETSPAPAKAAGHKKEKKKPAEKGKGRSKEKGVAVEEMGSSGEGQNIIPERKSQGKGMARLNNLGSVGHWFQVLCFMHIPVFGFLYMLVKALRRKTPAEERHFAIAYLLYRVLILFLALTILYVLYKVGLQFVDGILDYAGMKN